MTNYQDVSLAEDMESQLGKILSLHQGKRQEVIPLLQEVQEQFGYLPKNAIKEISKFLKIPESKIYGVVTFYAQFYLTPRGKNIVRVCRGTACHVRGGRTVKETAEKFLNIKESETTSDYKFTLETVACVGTCFLAPVMMINQNYYGRLNSKKVETILKSIS